MLELQFVSFVHSKLQVKKKKMDSRIFNWIASYLRNNQLTKKGRRNTMLLAYIVSFAISVGTTKNYIDFDNDER